MDTLLKDELRRASHHVARAKLFVARQRKRVAQLKTEQRPCEDAQRQLDLFVLTLENLEAHHRLLHEEAEGKDRTAKWLRSRIQALAHHA